MKHLLFLLLISNLAFSQKVWRETFFESEDYGKKKDRNDGLFKQYDYVWAQPNGLYVVKKKVFYKDSLSTLNSYVIDKNGKIITKRVYTDIGDFSEGLAEVTVGNENFCNGCFETGRYSYVQLGNAARGFINVKGEEVIPLRYNSIGGLFKHGLVGVGDYRGMWVIDKTGKTKFNKVFHYVSQFYNGIAIAYESGKEINYIDTTGKYLIPKKYLYIEDFSYTYRGRIRAFQLPNKKYGFWTSENMPLIEAQFDEINYDNWNERVLVVKNKSIGFLDFYTGKTIVPIEYDEISKDIKPDHILLKKGNKWFRANFEGEVRDFITANEIKSIGRTHYKANLGQEQWILLDSTGKTISNNTYTKLGNRFSKGYILAQKQEKFGYIDSLGKEVIPSIYERIGVFENEKVYAEKGNKLYTLNKMGAVLNEKYTSSFLKSTLMYVILFLGLIIILWIFKEGRV